MTQLLIRFLVGGTIVSLFAVLGELLKPKSFAGLFGAAPSVALASFGLAVVTNGAAYAAQEARSMIVGAVAFFFYALLSSRLMMRFYWHAVASSVGALAVWFVAAFLGWWVCLR